MRVSVRVFGDLVPILGRRHSLELDEGATVGVLAGRIAESAGLRRHGYLGHYRVSGGDLAILVNGRNIDLLEGPGTVLRDGDEVVILPPAAGG
jgi:molybdopterin converting factor small subunit